MASAPIESCAIVHVSPHKARYGSTERQEFLELIQSSGAQVAIEMDVIGFTPQAKYFLTSGKVNELAQWVHAQCVPLVVVNHSLSPSQESALSRRLGCRVLDRTGLILDIFAQRARTFEGKLQVELAQLQHISTRLVHTWSHLERQKGGIGLRGPGETQLETDRRLIRQRIAAIQKQLVKVRQTRTQNRRSRQRTAWPLVALVGYTNAGKSTLFNALTEADIYAADQLFATLDPTLRRAGLPAGQTIMLADTVGFIRDLPTTLVAAFRATLEEVLAADLLLHVIDTTRDDHRETMATVNGILQDIGASDIPQVMVYNKVDAAPHRWYTDGTTQHHTKVWVSARSGVGLPALKQLLVEQLYGHVGYYQVVLKPECAALRAQLYQQGVVCHEQVDDAGCQHLLVHMTAREHQSLCAALPHQANNIPV